MRRPYLLLLVVLILGGISFSQSPSANDPDLKRYLGKWSFIKDESYRGASDRDLYTDYVVLIDRVGDKLRIVREYVYDSKTYRREVFVKLDGSGETNESTYSDGTVGLVRSNTRMRKGVIIRVLEDTDRTQGPADTEMFKVSEDGKRLRIERRYRPKAQGAVTRFALDRIERDLLVLKRIT